MDNEPDETNDPDNPEWTEDDFARARPFSQVLPAQFQAWKRGRGRPSIDGRPKTYIGFRLSADVVDAVKGSGPGYNGRVEHVLREAIARGLI